MRKRTRHLAHAAVIAAVYVVMTHMQNLLLPGSASWAIQLRLSEMLCVLAFFTPAAVPGLAVGCLVFSLTCPSGLPLDAPVGTAATLLAALAMNRLGKVTVCGLPVLGLLMPALFNGLLVGWELAVYMGGGFLPNAASVAAGELVALLIPGAALYTAIKNRHLDQRLFGG